MRPSLSRAIRRWFSEVMVPPSGRVLTHSVCSVKEKGAFALGGMTMLSNTYRVPPSSTWTGVCAPCGCAPGASGGCVCANKVWHEKKVKKVNNKYLLSIINLPQAAARLRIDREYISANRWPLRVDNSTEFCFRLFTLNPASNGSPISAQVFRTQDQCQTSN